MSVSTLIDELLEEQQNMTAVERFAQQHSNEGIPSQQKYYSRLLPASPPGPGQQLAFQVDLDKCSGCKACVTACHNLNGLDEDEAWRDVGLLVGGTAALPVLQHVTTACHHCVQPACAEACPVNAYDKDPVTGIVRHLDDQCFGCQYCTLACPYDVPKYNADKGIVRKCDMCTDRLSAGEAPACVQSCPHEAISIQTVDTSNFDSLTSNDSLVATAPASDFTRPTTQFIGGPRAGVMESAANASLQPQHAHWPLIVMLVLTQMSLGMFLTGLLLDLHSGLSLRMQSYHASVALIIGLVALVASTCHLGRPQFAFRALIGFKHSWLSREIVVFGAFAGAAIAFTGLTWVSNVLQPLRRPSEVATVMSGIAGVYCSAKIYAFTRRDFWRLSSSLFRFFSTMILAGVPGSLLVVSIVTSASRSENPEGFGSEVVSVACGILIACSITKLLYEATLLRKHPDSESSQLHRSAVLMATSLKRPTSTRFVCGAFGGVMMPLALALSQPVFGSTATTSLLVMAVIFSVAGEILERFLFFAAVSPDRMPGGLQL